MPTYASGGSAYATNADMQIRYDERTLGQLLSDDKAMLGSAEVAASATLTALLQQASGMVEAAACRGERYVITADGTRNDLASLTGNSKQLLAGLVCDLAMWLLWNRRPAMRPKGDMPGQTAVAMEFLDRLVKGDAVFGVIEAEEAGNVSDVVETADIPTKRLDLSIAADRLFGRRLNRLNG